MKTLSAILGVGMLALSSADAAVSGRYVRIEAPASARMGIHEIEVMSGGANIALKNREIRFAGVGHRGGNINDRNRGWAVIDGVADFDSRSPEFSNEGYCVNPWVEMDFGDEVQIEQVTVKSALRPVYADRAIRLITILDKDRRVLFSATWDIRRPPFNRGMATFDMASPQGQLVGRVVPVGAGAWAPLGDILEIQPSAALPGLEERNARFVERHSPTAIKQLSRDFFARMDLTKPELAGVKEKYDAGEHQAALDAYRDHFLRKIQTVAFIDEGGQPLDAASSPYPAAEDLRRGIAVSFERFDVSAQAFTPGTIDWANTGRLVGSIQMPLLLAYAETGDPRYLEQWAAISDDWGMNLVPTLDQVARGGGSPRNYFVKDPLQWFNRFANNLATAAAERPDLAEKLPGATLARLLIPVLEEYPPAYWWVCRRTVFNHTFNAMNSTTVSARVLDDFHAGQRLDMENRQHWERVWSMMMTRDGSMQEISDEGHLFMQWRMAAFGDWMKRSQVPWLTPDFLAEFETGWRQTATYPLRHLSPDGFGHRLGSRDYDYFNRLWWLIEPQAGVLELGASDTLDNTHIVREPEFEGIMQAVFGAAHDRESLTPTRQEYYDRLTGFYGTDYTPPRTVSDWMPYAGLWYLRRSWAPDATYVHMLCQPKGHPSANGSAWNTEVHYFDYGAPLLALSPVWINGQPPFNEAGTQTYKPGSKTEALTTASEFPIPARWHTSELLDYAESFYEGTYQTHRESRGAGHAQAAPALGESPVKDARADRRVVLFRPARLLIVTDAVRAPASDALRHYEIRQRFATPNQTGNERPAAGTFHGDARALTLVNKDAPGVALRRFTTADLSWDRRKTPDSWDRSGELGGPGGAAMMDHRGVLENRGGILRAEATGNLLMTALVEPHRLPGETTITDTTDLSTDSVTGFTATLTDGATLTWLATGGDTQTLKAGPLEIQGQAVLFYEKGNERSGIILGAQSLRLNGKNATLKAPDAEFEISGSQFVSLENIYRPILPVTFSPQETVFTGSQQVTMASATPGVEIRYTLDGSEPGTTATLYSGPLTLSEDSYLRARAFRPGLKAIPFSTAGTEATVISEARYYRRDLRPAVTGVADSAPGLRWELVEGNWFQLFSHLNLPEVMPAVAKGHTERLLDVTMRRGDGAFGVRYQGYIDVPADGVWTFHAPAEYVGATCEPGYDLRLWIGGDEWDLGQRHHGRGIWSVPLAKGQHHLLVTFADARNRDRIVHKANLWGGYPSPWVTWNGEVPVIEISGPGVEKQPLPDGWLHRQGEM